jgi:hypothetical protein
MIYELRIYKAIPGKLGKLNERLEKHWIGLFEKHGMKVIGFWTAVIGTSNTLYYMLGYDSLAHRDETWKSLKSDPEVQELRKKLDSEDIVTEYIDNIILTPTPYSPMK